MSTMAPAADSLIQIPVTSRFPMTLMPVCRLLSILPCKIRGKLISGKTFP